MIITNNNNSVFLKTFTHVQSVFLLYCCSWFIFTKKKSGVTSLGSKMQSPDLLRFIKHSLMKKENYYKNLSPFLAFPWAGAMPIKLDSVIDY